MGRLSWYPAAAAATKFSIGLPAGGIIGLDTGYSVPSGFNAYDTNAGRFILPLSTANTTGGSSSVASLSSDAGTSSHNPTDAQIFTRTFGQGTASDAPVSAAGSHTHTVTLSHTPKKAGLKLIQVVADHTPVPEGGIIFGDSANLSGRDTGLTTHNDQNAYLSHETATGITAESNSCSSDTVAFSHKHHEYGDGDATATGWESTPNAHASPMAGPAHSHTVTPSYTPSIKKAILKAFKRLAEHKELGARTIIMFDGATIPSKWALCDGENGTINLIDHFIQLATSGLGNKSGNNTISGSASLAAAGTHSHPITDTGTGWFSGYSHINNHSHTHSATLGATAFVPPYRSLKFIQFIG